MGKRDQDWRQFEEVIYQILLKEYNITSSEINRLTDKTHDGGYDGIFYVPLYGNTNSGISMQMLFEAKLRGNYKKDLTMQEFSKALVIALNRVADRVIIATNLHFSSGTILNLDKYAKQTGLEIQIKTGREIFQFIDEPAKSKNHPISSSLWHLLKDSYNYVQKFPATQTFFYAQQEEIKPIPTLFGEERKKELASMIMLISEYKHIFSVIGVAGVGKSIFIKNLLAGLDTKEFQILSIDLQFFSTPRQLFLMLVGDIWGMSEENFQKIPLKDLEEMFQWVGDKSLDEGTQQLLASALSSSVDAYMTYADIFEYTLVDYFIKLLSVRKRKRKLLLVFFNINYATNEVLSFLMLLLKKADGICSILLEIRSDFYSDGKITKEQWDSFLHEIKTIRSYQNLITLESLEHFSAIEYIQSISDFTIELCKIIIKKMGTNPLFLGAYIQILNQKIQSKQLLPEQLNYYVRNDVILTPLHLLDVHIRDLVKQYAYLGLIFFALGVGKGEISLSRLSVLMNLTSEKLEELLELCKFLCANTTDGQGNKMLKVTHDLYITVLRKYDYITRLQKQIAAENMLKCYAWDKPKTDAEFEIAIDLYGLSQQSLMLFSLALKYAQILLRQSQFSRSFTYFLIAEKSISASSDEISLNKQLECFYGKILCQLELKQYNNSTLSQLEMCKVMCQQISDSTPEDLLRLLMLENRYYHYKGDFKQADFVSKTMIDIVETKQIHGELAEKVWAERAIAIKEVSSLDIALRLYSKLTKEFPNSAILRYARVTHLSSKYSSTNPWKTLYMKESISEIEHLLPLKDKYHNKVNIAINYFLVREYRTAHNLGIDISQQTYIIGIKSEEGRITNLLGCIKLVDQDYSQAEGYFEHGIAIFQRGCDVINLWPLYINVISMTLKTNLCSLKAVDAARQCLQLFSESYALRMAQLKMGRGFPKLFVGALVLSIYYKKECQYKATTQIISLFQDRTLRMHISQIENYEQCLALLDSTVYVHNGVICVKS